MHRKAASDSYMLHIERKWLLRLHHENFNTGTQTDVNNSQYIIVNLAQASQQRTIKLLVHVQV